jgi:probable phosphoglycerate mutase
MTTIYLIRHAEAEGNLYRRIHGQYDSLVTQRGRKQIEALEKRFAEITVDFVYSSDLRRARETAGAVTKSRGIELAVSRQLREVNMGVWEDLTWGEVERFEPEQLEYFNSDPTLWNISGREDFYNLQKRLNSAICDIAAKHDGRTVAVVSHGSAIRTFLCGVFNVPPQEIKRIPHCDNTAVALLRIDDRTVTVDYQGDNTHLPEALSTFANQKWWRENTTFDSTNLRFVPFDLKSDAGRYLKYRRDAWETIYGSVSPPDNWLQNAEKSARAHSRAVSLALIYDMPVGMIELDVKQGEDDSAGTIEFFYLEHEHRRTGIAVQLLGQAVSVFRSMGREKLRMAVSEKNEQTLGFCEKYGFKKTGERDSAGGRHIVLEMDIKVQ